MYRCGICSETVAAGQPVRRHVLYRTVPYNVVDAVLRHVVTRQRQEIAREVPVCQGCEMALRTLSYVRLCNAYRIAQDASCAASLPKSTPTPPSSRLAVPGASSSRQTASPCYLPPDAARDVPAPPGTLHRPPATVHAPTDRAPAMGKPVFGPPSSTKSPTGLRGLAAVVVKTGGNVLQCQPQQRGTGTNSEDSVRTGTRKETRKCDVCKHVIGTDAQTTADTVLCGSCARKCVRRGGK